MMIRRGREFWGRAVAAAEAGGASHAAVAARLGVEVSTLRSWIYRLRRERRAGGTKRPVRVLPVVVTARPAAAAVTLRLGDISLEFAAGAEPAYLAAVAVAVRAAAC